MNYVHHMMVDIVPFLWEHCDMISSDLKATLAELGITQADFARLIDITPRAVALWMADERAIPGPAEAYIRLLKLLPLNLRQVELSRLIQKGTAMRDGMFGITFQGQEGAGMGVLVFDNGRVYGTDTEGVRYDGEYLFNESSGLADIKLKVTFPPNVKAVFGISNPYEWAFDVTTTFNPKQQAGAIAVKTSIGKPIDAQFRFLRGLPEAA
jgi:transcriptional regulator with XRE-family HTH domain